MSVGATITGWCESLRARRGWPRAFAAFAFGFASALAFPPTSFFPILWIGFPALILLLRGAATPRAAFACGWSFAFGYFLLGLYWIAASMFVDIGRFWWAVPLAVAGLPAFLALYYGLAAALAKRLGLDGVGGASMFALLWFLGDYARGHLLTGFPWNLEGYAWAGVLPVLQSVSVGGIYGLTLLTLVAACLPVAIFDRRKFSPLIAGFGILLFAVVAVGGVERLAGDDGAVSATRLRIVQPNVAQEKKWDEDGREGRFRSLLDLSFAPSPKPVSAIIWPETASTFYLAEDAAHRYAIASRLPPGTVLLTGVIRRSLDANGVLHYANSLVAVDDRGSIAGDYDKAHLVPFGEYIPFRRYLRSLPTLVHLGVDFSAGDGLRTLRIDGLPSFSPFICYEAIFPGEVARRDDRPAFLVNVTNDGWYGKTAGPYQHFAIARVRAIEEGLPLARAANTGISGMIDPYGRIAAKLDLGKTGFVDADLPPPLPPTMFSRYGEMPLWGLFAGLVIVCGILRWRRGGF